MGYSYFSTKIRELRKEAGYTQAEVSRLLNLQRQTYSNYENASRTPPLEVVVDLANLYHISVDTLVQEPGQPNTSPNASAVQFIGEFSSLSERKQREVMDFIEFKKHRPE